MRNVLVRATAMEVLSFVIPALTATTQPQEDDVNPVRDETLFGTAVVLWTSC